MAPPTLQQLLNFYRDHDLPKDLDPAYKDATVEGIPVCGADAPLLARMSRYPNEPDNVLFLQPETSMTGFLDVDTSLYRRFLSGTGGLLYSGSSEKGGDYVAQLDLCRKAEPSSGKGAEARYSVFATKRIVSVQTDDDILNNHPDVPGLRDIDFDFSRDEIVAIVRGVKLERIHYRVHEHDLSRLMVFPELTLVDRIIAFINSPNSPIAAGRRKEMVKALNEAMASERKAAETQAAQKQNLDDAPKNAQKVEDSIKWSTLIGVLIGAPPGLIMAYGLARQFGWTKPVDRFIDGAMNFVWEKMGLSHKVDFTKEITPEMVQKGEIRQAIGREEDYLRLREMLNQERARIATVIARAGEGKTHFLDGIANEIYSGRMPEFEKGKTSVFKLSLSALIGSEDAKYVGQLQTRWNDFVRQVERESKKGRKVVVLIDEIHRISGMGATEGGGANDLGNTIKDKISEWERNPNIRMIGATTVAEYEQLVQNPQTKQRDEALERRFPSYRLQSLSYETMRKIIDDSASEWSQKSGVEIPVEARTRALDLGFHEKVQLANPDAALDILDRAHARARTRGEKTVSADTINEVFAEKYNVDAAEVSAWKVEGAIAEKIFADIILDRYPEFQDAKFEQAVAVAEKVARKLQRAGESDSDDDPSIVEKAVRKVADKLEELQDPDAQEFRSIIVRRTEAEDALKEVAGESWNHWSESERNQQVHEFLSYHRARESQADGGRGQSIPFSDSAADYLAGVPADQAPPPDSIPPSDRPTEVYGRSGPADEAFLEEIGLDQADRDAIQPGELAKAVILRLAATGKHPEVRQELALLNRFMERNPALVPDRDELVRMLLTNRLTGAASPDRAAKSTAEVVKEYAEKKNLEEESKRVLGEAARLIDRDLEKSRREEEERRTREREGK